VNPAYNKIIVNSVERLAFLSDDIFSVAMTLLKGTYNQFNAS
jgi:hypothetical protein